jgi:hypothetical protein
VVRADFHWLWGKRRKVNKRSPASGTIRNFVRGGAVEPIRPWLR